MRNCCLRLSCRFCGLGFTICHQCFRGQSYCSASCRQQGRRRIVRNAGQKYGQTSAGRESHRKRQRKYRTKSSDEKIETHPSISLTAPRLDISKTKQTFTEPTAGESRCCLCLTHCVFVLRGLRDYQLAWRR